MVEFFIVFIFFIALWFIFNKKAKVFNRIYNPVAKANGFESCHEMAQSLGFRNMVEYENMFKSRGVRDKQKIAEFLAYDYDLQVIKGLSGDELEKQAIYDAHVQIICDTTGLKKETWESLSEKEQKDLLSSPEYIKRHLELLERKASR